jgi:hypothetical protein
MMDKDEFTKELKKYFADYSRVSRKYSDFQKDLSSIYNLPSRDVPKFVNLLVESVLSNLSQKHSMILDLQEANSYSHKILLATHKGIKTREHYGSISRDLRGNDILNMFIYYSREVEDWIQKYKPLKLAGFISIKQAFLNGYQDGFCKNDEYRNMKTAASYDIIKSVPDTVVSIINEDKYSDLLIGMGKFTVSEIMLRYSIGGNDFDIYLIDKNLYDMDDKELKGAGIHKFSYQDALENIELRQLLPEIEQVMDDAAKHRDVKIAELRNWFNTFKASMNKWVSIMNI